MNALRSLLSKYSHRLRRCTHAVAIYSNVSRRHRDLIWRYIFIIQIKFNKANNNQRTLTFIQLLFILWMIALLHQGVQQYVCRVIALKAVLGVLQQLVQGRRLALERQGRTVRITHLVNVGWLSINSPYPAHNRRVFYPPLC